ncbi:MAG: membrane protein insertion efficiency factor YidD [Deltaproteobacteria bacterium]|nr:membrane protein insertion efficiency factor YidD [Deltaproteobacteria bacterium]
MILLLAQIALAQPTWGPWNQAWAPVGEVAGTPQAAPPSTSLVERAYRWYRGVSEHNGGGCPYYPTCSAYGVIAIRKHGLVVGALFTTDRLFREYPWMDHAHHYPLVTPHGFPRLYDPVPDAGLLGERPERRRRRDRPSGS